MNHAPATTAPKTTSAPGNGVPAPISAFSGGRSQATQVEQARAIAEVQAAVLVAHEHPRDVTRSTTNMMETVNIPGMAERFFFSFPRGGQTVSGASVHAARELARCWGNINYGVKELSRNDAKGESEMLAFAIDLETNTRTETTFIVPHFRDKKGGPVKLTDMRDIYENNANNGARRVRECIFAVLPKWYTDMAEEGARKTLEDGGGEPLPQRRAAMIAYAEKFGVTRAMIEKREGCSADVVTAEQLANLKIVFRSMKNGEITKDEAFPETPADDVAADLKTKAAKQTAPKAEEAPQVTQSHQPQTDTAAEPETRQEAAQPQETAKIAPTSEHAKVENVLRKKLAEAKGVTLFKASLEDYGDELNSMQAEDEPRYKKLMADIYAKFPSLKG